MFVELNCRCEAHLQIDAAEDDDDCVWSLIWRFSNSHVSCGYVTPGTTLDTLPDPRKLITRPGTSLSDVEE